MRNSDEAFGQIPQMHVYSFYQPHEVCQNTLSSIRQQDRAAALRGMKGSRTREESMAAHPAGKGLPAPIKLSKPSDALYLLKVCSECTAIILPEDGPGTCELCPPPKVNMVKDPAKVEEWSTRNYRERMVPRIELNADMHCSHGNGCSLYGVPLVRA